MPSRRGQHASEGHYESPGMTPEEIENRIAVPIEVEMLGIPNTKILRSVTKYGLADVTIDFQDGTDLY